MLPHREPQASISQLPTELLLPIAASLPSQANLNALCLVNKRFHNLFNEILYKKDANTMHKGFQRAVSRGLVDSVRLFLTIGDINVNAHFFDNIWRGDNIRDGSTALIWATKLHKPAMVKLLLEFGANIEAANGKKRTALLEAAFGMSSEKQTPEIEDADSEIVRILLNAGANPNAKDQYGEAPLMWCAKRNASGNIVRALLDKGADLELNDGSGRTAWDCTADFPYGESTVKGILEEEARKREQAKEAEA